MRTIEIARLFGGNCIITSGTDAPEKVTSVCDLLASLRARGVTEQRINQAILELKDQRKVTIQV